MAGLNIVHALGGASLTVTEAKARSKALRGKIAFMKVHPATVIRMLVVDKFDLIAHLKSDGHGVMLDDKSHDIATEVAEFVGSYAACGVDILTVHASGGPNMLKTAVGAAKGTTLNIFGVTLLTSIQDWEVPKIYVSKPTATLLRLMGQVVDANCHGSVCAPRDLNWMRRYSAINLKARTRLCPGIRDPNKPIGNDDQNLNRSLTPFEAGQLGINLMVIGRQISQSPDPAGEAELVQEQYLAGKEAV